MDPATINLQLPDWLQEVGSFVLLNDDGSTAEAPAAVNVADSNLRALPLQADQLERLAFIPTRQATGRAPLSLQWQQDFVDGEVPAVRITQPLELRFRDGGDRIPSTASVAANSSSLDRWTLSLPSDADLIDGISGRRLALGDLVSTTAEEGSISDLPGWDQILGRVPTAQDIRLEVNEGSDGDGEAIWQLTATGSQARAFMDGLWLLDSDELADSNLSLTHSQVLRASLVTLEDGDAIERRVLVPELRGELTYRLEVDDPGHCGH